MCRMHGDVRNAYFSQEIWKERPHGRLGINVRIPLTQMCSVKNASVWCCQYGNYGHFI
jgi:hypothetical protein